MSDRYTQEDFEALNLLQKEKSQGKESVEYNKLKAIYDKLGSISDIIHRRYGYKTKIKRCPVNQGNYFEAYHWAKIYPKGFEDTTGIIFVVIGFTPTCFEIHLDSNYKAGYKPSPIANEIRDKSWVKFSKDNICKKSFDELAEEVHQYIERNISSFCEFGQEFGIASCINYLNNKKMNCIGIELYTELLKSNHNLILSGAPGTGKTYLARQIARAIVGSDTDDQIGFVQFHPSFDYTDFVEGLRPVTEDGKVVFERQNGIFKEFCRKALINSRNAEKSQEELDREAYIDQFIEEELDRLLELGEAAGLKTHSGNPFIVAEHNDHKIQVYIPNNPITSRLSCNKSELKTLLTTEGLDLQKVKDITLFFNRGGNSQSDSYLFSLFKHFMGQEHAYRQGYKEEKRPREELKTFVFIIDEINRGELSKIFGELFYAIDPGYRGEKGKVQTQYQNMVDDEFADGFYIPQNVYIIGTMNDIDRSIESMDFAIRRRFAFRAITAEERICMLDETTKIAHIVEEAKDRMRRLNEAISQTPDLSSAYHIGAAYFKKLAHYYTGGNAEQAFEQLWQYHLQGILYEYLRSMPHAEASMQKLQEAYGYTHKDEHQGDDQAKGQ